jgi:hypothetical protein
MKRQRAETMESHRLPILDANRRFLGWVAYLAGVVPYAFLTPYDVRPVPVIISGFVGIAVVNIVLTVQENRRNVARMNGMV